MKRVRSSIGVVVRAATLPIFVWLLAPAVGQAQLGHDLDAPGWRGSPSVVLDDGLGDDVPWEPSYVGVDYLPAGSPLAALTARVGGFYIDDPYVTNGPSGEIAVMLDVRFGSGLWHLRVGAVLGMRWSEARAIEGGRPGPPGQVGVTAPLSGSVRLQPIVFDVVNLLTLRVGADLGLQWVPSPGSGHLEWMPEGSAEVVYRDAERGLELGVYGGVRGTAVWIGDGFTSTSIRPQVIFGVCAGAFLP